MNKILSKPELFHDKPTHYCPGCGHGVIHRLVAEVIEELGIKDKVLATAPVGCAILIYNYLKLDFIEPPHGRSPAAATGMKRCNPDKFVLCYQGDGDLAAIGTAETVHAANRGENITIIFVNNAIYGMTGGQMAPTTLIGQKTLTTPKGRDEKLDGEPIKVCEMLKSMEGVAYLERCAVNNAANIMKTKQAIKKAFQCQLENKGFSLVEILSQCPTNWKVSTKEANEFIDKMIEVFPLGECKKLP